MFGLFQGGGFRTSTSTQKVCAIKVLRTIQWTILSVATSNGFWGSLAPKSLSWEVSETDGTGFQQNQMLCETTRISAAGAKPMFPGSNGIGWSGKDNLELQIWSNGSLKRSSAAQRRRCQGTHDRVREHESENRNVGVREQERRSQGTIRRSQGTYAYSAHSKVRSVCEQCTKCLNWVKCAKYVKSAQKVRKKCVKCE